MTEVLHSPQSSSPSSLTCAPSSSPVQNEALLRTLSSGEEGERVEELEEVCSRVTTIADGEIKERERERDQLSLLALLLALFRKSFWIACKTDGEELSGGGMEIGWPTNVRHVAHVTFDRFNGFLGLPDEFEPEVPRRAPSASTTVFGVSTESMQMSFDSRGNSVPVILILLQRRLYAQGGLQAEGIFRINAENSQEEFVREQLNRGVVPQGIDVHCLAGLIKAWFRELPTGVLDSLSPEQVMQCRSEEDCAGLVRLLPSTEAALLGWAINLMADVVEMEHMNKMNAHNIAMVFAPNMTQMVDPLTALMYAVQVMNFLKSLITKTLRERVDSAAVGAPVSCTEPSDESGNRSPSQPSIIIQGQESASESNELGNTTDGEGGHSYSTTSMEESYEECESPKNNAHAHQSGSLVRVVISEKTPSGGVLIDQSSVVKDAVNVDVVEVQDKGKGISNLSLINSLTQRIEAWR